MAKKKKRQPLTTEERVAVGVNASIGALGGLYVGHKMRGAYHELKGLNLMARESLNVKQKSDYFRNINHMPGQPSLFHENISPRRKSNRHFSKPDLFGHDLPSNKRQRGSGIIAFPQGRTLPTSKRKIHPARFIPQHKRVIDINRPRQNGGGIINKKVVGAAAVGVGVGALGYGGYKYYKHKTGYVTYTRKVNGKTQRVRRKR